MVADLSGQRAGVYLESVLMSGLGRTVIWSRSPSWCGNGRREGTGGHRKHLKIEP